MASGVWKVGASALVHSLMDRPVQLNHCLSPTLIWMASGTLFFWTSLILSNIWLLHICLFLHISPDFSLHRFFEPFFLPGAFASIFRPFLLFISSSFWLLLQLLVQMFPFTDIFQMQHILLLDVFCFPMMHFAPSPHPRVHAQKNTIKSYTVKPRLSNASVLDQIGFWPEN